MTDMSQPAEPMTPEQVEEFNRHVHLRESNDDPPKWLEPWPAGQILPHVSRDEAARWLWSAVPVEHSAEWTARLALTVIGLHDEAARSGSKGATP